jgi:uncharacterized protein YdhG (YjbR/CyaY superfamily)
MAKTDYQSVDEYIASQPKDTQRVLRRVRAAVRRGARGTTEVISYQIPAYKLDGRAVIYFAGWKEHYSLYPATQRVLETFASELTGHHVSKGTIRFSLALPIPDKLIERIAKLRTEETAAIPAAKRAARKGAAKAGARKPAARKPSAAKKAARKPSAAKKARRAP